MADSNKNKFPPYTKHLTFVSPIPHIRWETFPTYFVFLCQWKITLANAFLQKWDAISSTGKNFCQAALHSKLTIVSNNLIQHLGFYIAFNQQAKGVE